MPDCKSCGYNAEDFKELSQHILRARKTHPRWQVVWAEKFLTNAEFLNQKQDAPQGRAPISEQEKQNKEDAQRIISGITKTTLVLCPNCRQKYPQRVEVEHLNNPTAWRNGTALMIGCPSCRSRKSFNY